MINQSKGDFKKSVYILVGFVFMQHFVHISISSVLLFIHYLLDHDLPTIETWLNHHGWELLLGAKCISYFILFKWFQIRLFQIDHLKFFKTMKMGMGTSLGWGLLFFWWGALIYWSKPQINDSFIYFTNEVFRSYLMTTIYFILTFMILFLLFDVYQIKTEKLSLKQFMIYPLILSLSLFFETQDFYSQFPFLILQLWIPLLLISSGPLYRLDGLIFLFLFISPCASILGTDLISGQEFAVFRFSQALTLPFVILLGVLSYLSLTRIKLNTR